MWSPKSVLRATCLALAGCLFPHAVLADPITLVNAERQVRALIGQTENRQVDQDALVAQQNDGTIGAFSALSSDISNLRQLTGMTQVRTLTSGETFDKVPLADSRYTVTFQLTSPQSYNLFGNYGVEATVTGQGGITQPLAIAQFLLATYDPVRGVADSAIFNDVFSAHNSTSGVVNRSGLLDPGFYAVHFSALAEGSEGIGVSSAGTGLSFRFELQDSDLAATPEPATLTLLGTGAVGLLMSRRRKRAA